MVRPSRRPPFVRHVAPLLPVLLFAAAAHAAPPPGGTDLGQLQRGYLVYSEVCSGCHAMQRVTFADLAGHGLTHTQIRAIAAAHRVTDGTDPAGRPIRRPAGPADHLPSPFPTEAAALAANDGALPPDMSRLALTLPGGARYIDRLLTGYGPPPPGIVVPPGSYANAAAPDGRIAMPPPLQQDQVHYADGTPATVPQMAADVSAFLDWAAHPHAIARRRVGISVVLYLVLLTGLLFLLKRRVWSNVP